MVHSKIIFKKKSKKAVTIENDLQLEVLEMAAAKLFEQTVLKGLDDMNPEIFDPEYIRAKVIELIEPKLAQRLVNSEFGQGFIMGIVCQHRLERELEGDPDYVQE